MDAPIRIALPADTRTLYISRADDATDTARMFRPPTNNGLTRAMLSG